MHGGTTIKIRTQITKYIKQARPTYETDTIKK
jgi:hypothetical protein